MRIFDMDGPVYRIGTELADIMILTLYWFVCCIPIITIGASTSSLFYVYGKKVREEDVYVTRDFFKSFKQNFKQSVPITIVLGLLWMSASMYLSIIVAYGGRAPVLLTGVAIFFIAEVCVISIYVLALLSRFYMKLPNIFMTAFVLTHKHLLTSLMLIVTIVVLNIATLMIPILTFVLPALIVAMLSYFVQKVFAKHIEVAANAAEEQSGIEVEQELQLTETTEDQEEADKDFLKYI
ncbi:MAG: YesL family protein [Cellulosilyticaceae bacterium]